MTPRPERTPAVLVAALVVLVLVRIMLESVPGAWCWGLDYGRYLAASWRWGPWLATLGLAMAAALPPVRRAVAPRVESILAWPAGSTLLAAVLCGALCYSFPDLTYFTGDFALRRSAVVGITEFDRLFPQASALDRFLHSVLPRTLISWSRLAPASVASVQGAVSAALFGALAMTFARRIAVPPAASLVAAATVLGSAALGLFTGYEKSLVELTVVTLAFAVAGAGELTRARPGWASGLMAALAIALHRSGLALVPPWLLLCAWVPRPHTADRRALPWMRLVPGALMAAQAPAIWKVSQAVDARHLAPTGLGHVLSAAVAPERLIALANLVAFLAPLVPLLPFLLGASRTDERRSPLRWLTWLAACWALPMLAIHPVQGEFRDWDDFAAAAVAISLPLAILLARAYAKAPAGLAAVLIAAAFVPRLQWLALEVEPERALARIESWTAGPPTPPPTVAASTLEFVAVSHYREGRIDDGRRTMAAAIAQVPWERLFLGWANAEARAGDWSRAVALYEVAGGRFPSDRTPWVMLVEAAFKRRDLPTAARGVSELRRLAPDDPWTLRAESALRRMTSAPASP